MSLYLGNQKVTPTIYYKDNKKFTQLVDGTISEVTAEDLKDVTSIRKYGFSRCYFLTSVTIPDSVTSIGVYAFSSCSRLTSVTIGNGVTSIEEGAFYGNGFTNLTIPNSVTSIGDYAFYNCSSLKSIIISDGVTSIGYSAFYGCSRLTSIIMLPTTPPTIGSSTFDSNFSGTITVPAGTGDAYKAATNWSVYADKIQEAAV